MVTAHAAGAAAEQRARAYLESAGLHFVGNNFRCRGGEIDLIMLAGDTLVFVEVRYRRNQQFGGAAASVTTTKQRRLRIAACTYMQRFRITMPSRIDVISMNGSEIEWIINAIEAD